MADYLKEAYDRRQRGLNRWGGYGSYRLVGRGRGGGGWNNSNFFPSRGRDQGWGEHLS